MTPRNRAGYPAGSSCKARVSPPPLRLTAVPGGKTLATAAEPAAPAMGPGGVKLTLQVNGHKMTTTVEPRVTLLDALRNYLDVTGCKRVCDRGTCGACTVMLDGKPVYSCTMLALEGQGKQIRTAESLVAGGTARSGAGGVRPP